MAVQTDAQHELRGLRDLWIASPVDPTVLAVMDAVLYHLSGALHEIERLRARVDDLERDARRTRNDVERLR